MKENKVVRRKKSSFRVASLLLEDFMALMIAKSR